MNIVLVILDSLRQDHVGAYGNQWIKTPHWDAFAREAVRFTRAYSESLPTVPVRRTIHTGQRVYPFRGHREYKGAGADILGWAPIPQEQDTVAEVLASKGYRCALITDTYHQFKPSMNFHRGFDEWIWMRGQEIDTYRSGPAEPPERVARHMHEPIEENQGIANFLGTYLRNNSRRTDESDYFPARLFSEASRWVEDNRDAERFFLVVDSFVPHEPWDPPAWYRELYDPDDDVVDLIQTLHGTWQPKITSRQLKRLQANYAGEVTMVDRWFGHLMETLNLTGRLENTVVAVISDHGHNLGWDPGDGSMVGKQGHPMTHGIADLAEQHPGACEELLGLAIEDAGGQIPEFLDDYRGKPWCVPFEDRSESIWKGWESELL